MLRDVTTCSIAEISRGFWGTYYLRLQVEDSTVYSLQPYSTRKDKHSESLHTLVNFDQNIRFQNPPPQWAFKWRQSL